MDYLVSILAAVGGLVAGAGFGVALSRRAPPAPPPPDDRMRELIARLREKVTPMLERRAEILGLSLPPRTRLKVSDDRGSVELDGDEVNRIVLLASAIQAKEEAESVALSDTVQISQDELKPIRDSKRPKATAKSAT